MSSNNARVSITQSRRQEVSAVLNMFDDLFQECWNYGAAGSEALDELGSAMDDEEISERCSEVWSCLDDLSAIMNRYIEPLSNIDWDELKEGLRDLRNEDNQ